MKQFDTNPDRLRRQQAVMSHLKFYRGELDGIWGPASISAKKAFEVSGSFTGGLPNQGLPFNPNAQLPSILYRDPQTGLVCHPELSDEKLTEMFRSRGNVSVTKVSETQVSNDTKKVEQPHVPTQQEPQRQENRKQEPQRQEKLKQKHRQG